MIKHITYPEIDKQKWDRCIERSRHGKIYAYSWFLDRMSSRWEGLVEDDYKSVFPLTWNRKFGICYLYQPFFTQQLGLFSSGEITPDKVQGFLTAIPSRFRYIDISLNSSNFFQSDRYELFINRTCELDLKRGYDTINRNFSENTRRNIKKAGSHSLTVAGEGKPGELIDLFRNNMGRTLPRIRACHYGKLLSVMQEGIDRGIARIYTVYGEKGGLCAGACFIFSNRRFVFLFSAANRESRDTGAMFLLVDRFIRDHAGEDNILDFMGSNNENLARFYKGFGSAETTYPGIKINNLPRPVKWLKK
ncbi:MAG: GNAT family N-acetyltransferase [Bacteroidales bacterium]|nr:MAG: GNAT family N-acetyltransferase [Bacteroidales bacterium]